MDPEEELEALKWALHQISVDKEAKQLELAQISAEALRLKRRIAELLAMRERDDEDGSDSDQESFLGNRLMSSGLALPNMRAGSSTVPNPPPLGTTKWSGMPHPEWRAGSTREYRTEPSQSCPLPGSMRHLVSEDVLWAGATPLGSLLNMPTEQPPCLYSCFRAGPPLVCTALSDVATLGCHWWRSMEVTALSSDTLASQSEQSRLQEEYTQSTMKIKPVVNFIVWRRSLIVLLFLACVGAFFFAAVGDNGATLRHMRDMHRVADFEVSYDAWREKTIADLPTIHCEDLDAHFGEILVKHSKRHEVAARSCAELMVAGVGCSDPVSKAMTGCWQPGFCWELIGHHCPAACSQEELCKDVRDAGTLTYEKFTGAFLKAMVYMLMEQLSKAELYKLIFLTASKLVTALLLLLAAMTWADWSRSSHFLMWAWIVTFCAPFMRSIVPTPILIDWRPIDKQLEGFLVATNDHYNVTTRMQSLADAAGISCKDHVLEDKLDSTWGDMHSKTLWWCGKVSTASRWFPWSSTLQKGAQECAVVTSEIGIGDDATQLVGEDKEKLCGLINRTKVEDVKDDPLSSLREVFDVSWVRNSAFGFIGTMSSVLSFRALMPLALSVAPGLLTAAIRIKVMIPESYLPGVFIVIMPLLYVPLIWSFSMFLVQGLCDPHLLAGIALLALSPLVYTLMALAMRVTSPMSRKGASSFANRIWWTVFVMRVAAVACVSVYCTKVGMHLHQIETANKGLAAFLIEQGKELLLPLLIGQVDNLISIAFSGPLWSLVFSFLVQLYLTAVVASDWMLRASAEEWDSHGEECLVELQELGQLDDKHGLEALHKKREAAMTAMRELTFKKQSSILGH